MAKKMCKHFGACYGMGIKGRLPKKMQRGCPRNTNSKCEIIPPKRKVKRVKVWVDQHYLGAFMRGAECLQVFKGRNENKDLPCFSCIIEIDEKYLGGK